MVKDFNRLIEDGALLKQDEIGSEAEKNRQKLVTIKEVYRKFRSCLKGESRDTWIKIVEDQPKFGK